MLLTTGCANFDRDFGAIATLAETNISSAEQLANVLQEIYRLVFDVDLAQYNIGELCDSGPEVLSQIYQLRISLRDRIPEWNANGFMLAEVQGGLRDVFRATRYVTDMLGEMLIAYDDISPGERNFKAFTGPHHNTLIHPALAGTDKVAFQSGDVLVFRGVINNSAAIARIGDVDSQFSHVAMVHIDERGHRRIVEALIAEGATISDFDYTLTHNLSRAILFRHRDAELAAKAADRIYRRVRKSQKNWKDHIFYDFTMELDSYHKLFCAKLIRQAYDEASHSLLRLPTFATTFDRASPDFLARIGTTAKATFAPGDMELEPEFYAIAEWRDYRKTSSVRLQDMVMVKLFEWMETRDFIFRETALIGIVSALSKSAGYLPNVVKNALSFVIPKIPSNIHRETIAVIAMLHKTAQPLLKELEAMEQRSIKETGRPLHPRDIYTHLDQVEANSGGRIGYLERS